MKFRKKPVVIEATQWFKNGDHPGDYSRDHDGFENGELRKFSGARTMLLRVCDMPAYLRTACGKWLGRHESESEIERLTADLLSCRGTVKTELAHYERLAMVHGKTAVAANYEAEAQRLSDLLDRIDALTATPTAAREA